MFMKVMRTKSGIAMGMLPTKGAGAAVCALAGLLALAHPVRAATPEQIDAAIKKGVAYLYKQQNDRGHWEKTDTKPANAGPTGADDGQWGGRTALCTYALLAAGENPVNDNIVKATAFLRKATITGHYAVGVRANVWLNLPETPENRQAMTKDARLLLTGMIPPVIQGKPNPAAGFFDYQPGPSRRIDISCSQYGVLGLWAVSQRVEGAAKDKWKIIEDAWRAQQGPDGGWAYTGKPDDKHPVNIQMTAAGLASLFIMQEYLHADEGIDGTKGNIVDNWINKGIAWVSKSLEEQIKRPSNYALYAVERTGVASGYKYFGNVEWFQKGADLLVKSQGGNGAWSNEIDTSFALLFLSRGRAPVMMNKLQYNISAGDQSKEANWNQRPRDVANITHWVGEKIERKLNWQIVNLNVAKIEDLHDSNILYIAGNQKLSFSDKEKAMLKQYVTEGGLIVGNADTGKADFANAFRTMGKELFPSYEFKPIMDKPDSYPLLSNQTYQAAGWKKKPKIEALSNGARLLMILLPTDDVSRAFQRRDENRSQEQFELFANLFMYSIDKTGARFKGETHVVRPNPAIQTTSAVKIARVKYSGNWDPEPGGWNRMTAILQNENKIKLETQVVELGKDPLSGFKIAHLTGTSKFTLTDSQRKALTDFAEAGGLIVVDACGGTDEFNESVQAELGKMYPKDAAQIASTLKKDHAFFTAGGAMTVQAKYRVFALNRMAENAMRFQLKGIETDGKLRVLYSAEDLSVGLVGQPVDGVVGYDPPVATALMKRMVMLKNEGKI